MPPRPAPLRHRSRHRWECCRNPGGTPGRRRDRDLFAGVVAPLRHASPLIWSDELASILFLCWRCSVRSRVPSCRAHANDRHRGNAKPVMRAYLDSRRHLRRTDFSAGWSPGRPTNTPTKRVSSPRRRCKSPHLARGGVPVGIGLMALFALLRWHGRRSQGRAGRGAVGRVLIGIFWLAQPWLRPLGNINLIIFFVASPASASYRVPIAFGFGLAIFGYLALTTRTPLMVLVGAWTRA